MCMTSKIRCQLWHERNINVYVGRIQKLTMIMYRDIPPPMKCWIVRLIVWRREVFRFFLKVVVIGGFHLFYLYRKIPRATQPKMASQLFRTELSPSILQQFKILIIWKARWGPKVSDRGKDIHEIYYIQIVI